MHQVRTKIVCCDRSRVWTSSPLLCFPAVSRSYLRNPYKERKTWARWFPSLSSFQMLCDLGEFGN